jgi:aminoglycoside 3-N-acetyltransferase
MKIPWRFKILLKALMPDSWLKKYRKTVQRKAAVARKKAREKAWREFGPLTPSDLSARLKEFDLGEAPSLFVHCSFNDLFNFQGSPLDVLEILLNLAGERGALFMPAFSTNTFINPPRLFDVKNEPTYTGLVNEIFRRRPGVIRSLHPRHSICGSGPAAFEVLSGHEKCPRADGPDSPFDRLRLKNNSWVLALGCSPLASLSFLHWVEDFAPEKWPFPLYAPLPALARVRTADERLIEVPDWLIRPEVADSIDLDRIATFLSPPALDYQTYKGIEFCLYHLKTLAGELMALLDKGIVHYSYGGE